MATANKDWLLTRTNIRRLMQAADDTADDNDLPIDLRRAYADLENALDRVRRALKKYDM